MLKDKSKGLSFLVIFMFLHFYIICAIIQAGGGFMKKLIAISICFVLFFTFVGCSNVEQQNEVAKAAFQEVLENKRNFSYKCLVFDKVTDESLKKFNFKTIDNAFNSFDPQGYAYLDFDQDGVDEMLIYDTGLSDFLILKYDGEKVNGYILNDNIDFKNVKKNGTFLTVTYNFDENYKIIGNNYYVCEVEFDGLDYSINKLTFQNQGDNIYKIDNKNSTKDEVEAYIENWKNNTTQVEWHKIEG